MATPNYAALAASNGNGEPSKATVQTPRTVGSTTITVNSTTNWPTGTFIATTGTVQANGTLNPITAQVFYGTASGTTITITSFAPGYTDKGNAISDVVVLKPTTEWANIIASTFATGIAVPQPTTGTAATISATGSDTNINLTIAPKGSGSVQGVIEHLYNPYKFRVCWGSGQPNFLTSGNTKIPFDTKIFDTSNNVDVVTNKGRFTAPVTGYYHIDAAINVNNGINATELQVMLFTNGNLNTVGSSINGSGITDTMPNISTTVLLAAGDYNEIFVYSNNGGWGVTGGNTRCWFSGYLICTT